MGFNNRTADGKSDPHSIILGCIERFKEPIGSIGSETNTGVLNRELDAFIIPAFRFNQQLSRPVVNAAHRIQGVMHQIQDDLLDLDTVAFHSR